MEEEITRNSAGNTADEITRASSASKRKTSSSSAKKKTSSSTAKKKQTSTTAKKKPASSTAKKKTASNTVRLSAAEKKLVTDFRKCGTIQKKIISLVVEKVAGGTTKLDGIERLLND
ncbi:MAG: hypothetical protein Q4C20_03950 [Erysipelotrichaceae bacterium]|nr:hypothetical protein [Erysipelotrichaceae bacterium]